MDFIKNKTQYDATLKRIDELIELIDDNILADDKNMIELDALAGLAEAYGEKHYPI